MQLNEGVHSKPPPHQTLLAVAKDVTEVTIQRKLAKVQLAYRVQQATLYLGLFAFVTWRSWDLINRAHLVGH